MARSSSYSAEELEVLVNCVLQYPKLVSRELGGEIPTKKHQNLLWGEITNKINSVVIGCVRTMQNVQAKWSDLKHWTKQKAAMLAQHRLATGGGPPEKNSLTELEEKILSVLGISSVQGATGLQFDVSLLKQRKAGHHSLLFYRHLFLLHNKKTQLPDAESLEKKKEKWYKMKKIK